jgi:hypothetical protein
MYKNKLTVYGEPLAKAQELPVNSPVLGNCGIRRAGTMLGTAEIVMVAASPVTIGRGDVLSLAYDQSTDAENFDRAPVSFQLKADDDLSFSAGTVMARLPLASDTPKFVRAVLETNGGGAAGTVDVMFEYFPG